jgi:hypothetical protein
MKAQLAALVLGDEGLGGAEPLGHLDLGEAAGLAQLDDPAPEVGGFCPRS